MSDLIIREPVEADIHALQPVFEQWIRDRNTGNFLVAEAHGVEESIRDSIAGKSTQHFLVAEEADQVLGIMGVQPPDPAMKRFTTTSRSTELITALVSNDARGKGVGRALVNALTERAAAEGATELVVNSGPRYQATGWPFWEKLFGKPVGTIHDYYGQGGDAMVWRKPVDANNYEPESPIVTGAELRKPSLDTLRPGTVSLGVPVENDVFQLALFKHSGVALDQVLVTVDEDSIRLSREDGQPLQVDDNDEPAGPPERRKRSSLFANPINELVMSRVANAEGLWQVRDGADITDMTRFDKFMTQIFISTYQRQNPEATTADIMVILDRSGEF